MSDNSQKMKMGKYISIAICSIIFFIAIWVISECIWDKDGGWVPWVFIILNVATLIFFIPTTLSIFGYSLRGLIKSLRIKQEKGLWKILTLVFRIAMLLFAVLILILCIVWSIFAIKDGIIGHNNLRNIPSCSWSDRAGWGSLLVVSGLHKLPDVYYTIIGVNSNAFGILVTSFVFILIWSAAGIVFEILKRFLGGYRPKKEKLDKPKQPETQN